MTRFESRSRRSVGYIVEQFPAITETFILNEILALEAQGMPAQIFAFERSNDACVHEDVARVLASICYIPKSPRSLWSQNQRAARLHGARYLRALASSLRSTEPRFFVRLLQAGVVAAEADRVGIAHLHAHYATRPATVASLASMITGIPFSFTTHDVDIHTIHHNRQVLAKKIRQAAFVVARNEYNKGFLTKIVNGASENIVRIYHGLALDQFCPNGRLPPSSPFTMLCVARFVEKKGHQILIEACARLRDGGITFQCWLVGDGPLRPQIEAQVASHNLSDCIRLLGARTQLEVLELIHGSHLFVLPCVVAADGDRDGIPVAILEALACGRPVVTTPVSGIPEVVRHRQNGLLVSVGDAHALGEAIESVIRDPELYEDLRAHARASVQARFDVKETTKQLSRLFEGHTDEKSTGALRV